MQRGEIRAKFNLKGSGFGDCCRSYWCPWHTLMQEEKELRLLAGLQQPLPLQPVPMQQGYQSVTETMHYAPPKQ
jgi:hypothetical protein